MKKCLSVLYAIAATGFLMTSCDSCQSETKEGSKIIVDSLSTSSKEQTSPETVTQTEVNDTLFIGEYTDFNDSSTLQITKNSDGQYSIVIELFRLTGIDDGIGTLANDTLSFVATDAAGNPIKGYITINGNDATLTFTDSTWKYLRPNTSFNFKRNPVAWKTFSGVGNGGGLAINLTIDFQNNGICECTSDFYQAFPSPVKSVGYYTIKDGNVEISCLPEGFESPIKWVFTIKDNGNELSFNNSDSNCEGSIGNDWITLSTH